MDDQQKFLDHLKRYTHLKGKIQETHILDKMKKEKLNIQT